MHQFLPPMLLNEYQKPQHRIGAKAAEIAELERLSAQMAAMIGELRGARR